MFIVLTLSLFGQNPGSKNSSRIEGDFKFLPIPYINYNRSIGFQIGALPMVQFNPVRKDTISPSSIAGLFGMYTSNKTYFAMGFSKLYFSEDNWRFLFAGGVGSVNFQFFLESPISSWIPYNTGMNMFFLEAQRRVYKKIYIGVSYIYLKFDTSTEFTENTLTTNLNGLRLKITIDERDNIYYPSQGYHNNIKYFTYPEFMGNDVESRKIEFDHNHYFQIGEGRDVIATRVFIGLGLGDLSFNQQFIVGRGSDLRGYTQGEFRGNYMVALQGEYRWNFEDSKFGLVGFLGVASIFEAINEDDNGKLLPGIGAGFRYNISEETNMNVGLDLAVGKNDWGIYFRVSEAF